MRSLFRLPSPKSYSLPVLVSTALHLLLVAAVAWGWQLSAPERKTQTPRYIEAKVLKLKASTPEPTPPPQQKTIDVAAQQAQREQEEKAREAQRRAEELRQQKAEQARKERERQEREAREQAKREQELAEQRRLEQQLSETLKEEEQMLEAQQAEAIAQSYSAMITNRIRQYWSRPPSARKGMKTRLRIDLVPTGRVVNVEVIDSSGNAAFDRSAVQAVQQAEQFPELQEVDSAVFEKHFRELIVIFDPKDLRL